MQETFYGKGTRPTSRYDLVTEHESAAWRHDYRAHNFYAPAKNALRAAQELAKLDQCIEARRPVMVGVSHTLGLLFSSKDKSVPPCRVLSNIRAAGRPPNTTPSGPRTMRLGIGDTHKHVSPIVAAGRPATYWAARSIQARK